MHLNEIMNLVEFFFFKKFLRIILICIEMFQKIFEKKVF